MVRVINNKGKMIWFRLWLLNWSLAPLIKYVFGYIVKVCLNGGGNMSTHRKPLAYYKSIIKTLLHTVVSNTPSHEPELNSQLLWWDTYCIGRDVNSTTTRWSTCTIMETCLFGIRIIIPEWSNMSVVNCC